jgi:hypothetical protein
MDEIEKSRIILLASIVAFLPLFRYNHFCIFIAVTQEYITHSSGKFFSLVKTSLFVLYCGSFLADVDS